MTGRDPHDLPAHAADPAGHTPGSGRDAGVPRTIGALGKTVVDIGPTLAGILAELTALRTAHEAARPAGASLVWTVGDWNTEPGEQRAVSARRTHPDAVAACYVLTPREDGVRPGTRWRLEYGEVRAGAEPNVLTGLGDYDDERTAKDAAEAVERGPAAKPDRPAAPTSADLPAVKLPPADLTVDGTTFDNAASRDTYLAIKALPQDRLLYLARSNGHQLRARGDGLYLSIAGERTNPEWVTSHAATIALTNGWIDEHEYDSLTR